MPAGLNIWKAIGVLMAFLSLIAAIGGSYVYIYNKGDDAGYTRRDNEYLTADNENLKRAQKETADAIQKLQNVEDQIRNENESDNRPAGPIVRRQLARMQ